MTKLQTDSTHGPSQATTKKKASSKEELLRKVSRLKKNVPASADKADVVHDERTVCSRPAGPASPPSTPPPA